MKKAGLFRLKLKDAAKGLITAAVSAALTALLQMLQNGTVIPTLAELKTVGIVGLTAGIAYLLKNFLTNSNDQFLTKDKPAGPVVSADGPGSTPPNNGPGGKP